MVELVETTIFKTVSSAQSFSGNQPLFTLFSCSNNSFIAHNDEVPVIAKRIEIRPQVNIAPAKNPNPAIKKTGQIFFEK